MMNIPQHMILLGALQACCQEALASKTWHVAREALKQLHAIMVDINDNNDGSKVRLLACKGMAVAAATRRARPLTDPLD